MTDQATPTEAPPKDKIDKAEAAPPPRRRLGPIGWIVLLVVLVAAVIGGMRLWAYLDSYEETDDAQIDGDIYAITSRISGTVKAVYVQDNEQVKAGQLLVELDPSDYNVAVEQAKAAVDESRTQVDVARPNVPITSVTTETAVSANDIDITNVNAQIAAAERDHESAVAEIRLRPTWPAIANWSRRMKSAGSSSIRRRRPRPPQLPMSTLSEPPRNLPRAMLTLQGRVCRRPRRR